MKEDENIEIRKVDKSNIYVIMDKVEYIDKLNVTIQDETKFVKLSKNPTENIKKTLNNLIDTSNKITKVKNS